MVATGLGLVIILTLVLTPKNERRTALILVLTGLLCSVLKVWLIQKAPQWYDSNPDSATYIKNATAFALHWNGAAVEISSYGLRGLRALNEANLHPPQWNPSASVPYSNVIASHEWLYTAYIAIWFYFTDATESIVISSHSLLAAFLPAAAFGIALTLGANRRVGLIASVLVMADPSIGVNASWLLKDTLVAFFFTGAVWAIAVYSHQRRRVFIIIGAVLLCLLGIVRFAAFLGLIIAIMMVAMWFSKSKAYKTAVDLMAVAAFAWLAQGILASIPFQDTESSNYQTLAYRAISTPINVIGGGVGVLKMDEADRDSDGAVNAWKNELSENTTISIAKIIARTFFSPYPWRAIYPGLTWESFLELYHPGTLLVIACLPLFFYGLATTTKNREMAAWIIFIFLMSQFAAYAIWHGGWSPRQRVFVHPIVFVFAALGWSKLRSRLANHTDESKKEAIVRN